MDKVKGSVLKKIYPERFFGIMVLQNQWYDIILTEFVKNSSSALPVERAIKISQECDTLKNKIILNNLDSEMTS